MSEVKRTLLVRIESFAEIAERLTGWGEIKGIDHEGTITYEISARDEFELGRLSYEVEHELNTIATGVAVITAVPPKKPPPRPTRPPKSSGGA